MDMSLRGRHAARVAVALLLVATTVAVTAIAAGCGGDDGSENVSANEIDRAFAAEMISHHEGAIDMAEVARERGAHREVRQLADDIIAAQKAEIRTLSRIEGDLEEMGIEPGDLGLAEHAKGVDADMSELEQADPFDRTFVEMMTAHHEGAIRMARKELADGKHEPLRKIADAIIAAQSREIAQMRRWSARWYGAGSGEAGHMEGSM